MKHKILSWIIVIVGALAVVVPVGLLVAWWFTGGSALWADQADGPTSDPYIYVDTEREVSPGQAFSLNPLYYNEHGLPEPGHRFSFEVSDEQVIKQNRDRGTDADSFSVLTASEEPQTITVVERNGKARTEVTVWITSELSEVYKRSEASVVAQYGAQFTLEVGTNPAESSITGRNVEITYAVLGPNGEQLTDSADATAGDDGDVFSLVETNAHALTFKANGLGTGKLCVTFRNDERQLKTTLVWEFGISLKETVLQNALIAEGTSALYGASDLAEIEALTLTDFPAQVDFSELSAALPNVKEIVLDGSDHILRNVGLPADCTFYVPETMLAQYGAAWGQDFRSVLPMQAYRGTLCAVLHEDYLSETSSSLSCWEAGDGALPELNDEANGYVFSGWYTEPEGGEPVTERPAGSTHLFAQWAPKGYRVTFDAAGPADQQFESLAVEYGEAIPKPLPQPVFDTWEFEGWHVDTIDGALFTADEPYPYTHDVALVARYKGTLTLSDKVAGEDETLPGVTYNLPLEASGAFPGLPQEKAASEGWSFEYWTSDAQLREKVEPSAPYTGKGNATLYARRAGTITLSDNLKTTENGSEETSSVTFYYGVTPAALTVPEDETTGWTFFGWCYRRAEEATRVDPAAPYTGRGDATLYARWTSTFQFHDALHDTSEERTAVRGEVVASPELTASGDGWSYEGWYATNTRTDPTGRLEEKPYFGNGGMRYEARWTAKLSFLDGFHENRDCGPYPAVYGVPLGDVDSLIYTKVESGWTFGYWSTDSVSLEAKVNSEDPYKGAADAVFYARWTCTINLRDALNSSAGDTLTVVYGIAPTLPKPAGEPQEGSVEKDGYVFDGWTTDQNAATLSVDPAQLANSKPAIGTLHARWKGNLQLIDDLHLADGAPTTYSQEVIYARTVLGNSGANINAKIVPAPQNDRGYTFKEQWRADLTQTAELDLQNPYTGRGDATYHAVWGGTLRLTDAVDTSGEKLSSVEVVYNTAPAQLPASKSEMNGWSFEGWYTAQGEEVLPGAPYTLDGNLELTAKRTGTLTLRDNLRATSEEDEEETRLPVVYGENPALPQRTDEGAHPWTFEGWYQTREETGTKVEENAPYTGKGNATLYSRWAGSITLRDDRASDVSRQEKAVSVTRGLVADFGTYSDSNAWQFAGWSLSQETRSLEDGFGVNRNAPWYGENGVTLYIRWEGTFTLSDNLGGSEETESVTLVYGIVETEARLVRTDEEGGWEFEGWSKDRMTFGTSDILDLGQPFTLPDANTSLYACWKTTLVYHNDLTADGTAAEQRIEVRRGLKAGRPQQPTLPAGKEGWDFRGWAETLTGEVLPDEEYYGAANRTLYAKWEATVTRVDPKAGDEGTQFTAIYNVSLESVGLVSPEATLGAWTFEGWMSEVPVANGAQVDVSAPFTGENGFTLYAVRTRTLTFRDDLNDENYSVKLIYNTLPSGALESDLPAAPQDGKFAQSWTFEGWYLNVLSAGEGAFDPAVSYTADGEGAYHARWKGSISCVGLDGTTSKEIVYGAAPNDWNGAVADDVSATVSALGWTFECWTTDEAARAVAFDPSAAYTGTGAFSVWPRWKGTITYLNNLTDSVAATEAEIYYSIPFDPLAVEAEEADGWTFAGWYTNRAAVETVLNPEAVCLGDVHSAQYESRWEGTLSLHDELPDSVPADVPIAVVRGVAPAEIEGHTPVDDMGWSFEGWCLDPASPDTRVEASEPYTGKGDAKLTARWTAQMKVDYLGGEPAGDAQKQETIQIVLGQPFGDLPASPTLQGWEFQGWKVEYVSKRLTNDGLVIPETTVDRWNNTTYLGKDFRKLYAVYTATITLKALAESEESEQIEVVLHGEISILPEEGADAYKQFRQDGYHYAAWQSGEVVLDATTQADLPVAVAGKTFTPVYIGNSYNYGYSDGEKKADAVVLPEAQNGAVYAPEAVTAQIATQQGMLFKGWKLSEDSAAFVLNWDAVQDTIWGEGEAFTFIPAYGAEGVSLQLVAQWEHVQFEVAFTAADDKAWAEAVHTVDYWDGENGGFCAPTAYPRKVGNYFKYWNAESVTGNFAAGSSVLEALQKYYDNLEEKPKYGSENKVQKVSFAAYWQALQLQFTFHKAPVSETVDDDEASYNYGEYAPEGVDPLKTKLLPPEDVPGYLNKESWTASYAEQTGTEIKDQDDLLAWIRQLAAFQYPNGYAAEEIDTPDTEGTLAIALQADFTPIKITIEYRESTGNAYASLYTDTHYSFADLRDPNFSLLTYEEIAKLLEEHPSLGKNDKNQVIIGWYLGSEPISLNQKCGESIAQYFNEHYEAKNGEEFIVPVLANRQEIQYSVSFDPNHDNQTAVMVGPKSIEDTIEAGKLEREGYVFLGWQLSVAALTAGTWNATYDGLESMEQGQTLYVPGTDIGASLRDPSGQGIASEHGFVFSLIQHFNLTFKAAWQVQTFHLHFQDGQEGEATIDVEYTNQSAAFYDVNRVFEAEREETFALKLGYAFLYWTSEQKEGDATYNKFFAGKKFLNADFRNGTVGDFYLVGEDGAAQSFLKYLQAYAQEEANREIAEFEITFTANWQEKMFKIVKQDEAGKTYNRYDTKHISMPYPELGGFTLETCSEPGFLFRGWQSNYGGDARYAVEKDENVIASMRAYADGAEFLLQSEINVIFTLDWTEKMVKITKIIPVHGNEAESRTEEEIRYSQFITDPNYSTYVLAPLELEGYFFKEWYLPQNHFTQHDFVTSKRDSTNRYDLPGEPEDLRTKFIDLLENQPVAEYTFTFEAQIFAQTIHIAVQAAEGDTDVSFGESPLSLEAKYFDDEADWHGFILPKPLRTGYGFDGWRITRNNGEDGAFAEVETAPVEEIAEWVKGQDAASHFSDVYLTFIPIWTEKKVSLTIETVKGDASTTAEAVPYAYSALVGNLQLFSPYEAGYIFTNWSATLGEAGSTDYGRGEPMYTAFMAYLDSERFYFGPNSASEGRYPSYKEGAIPIKLTAHYKAGTVSFKVDWALEGTENPAEIVLTVSDNEISSGSPYLTGFADGSVTPPQKKGYYFAGWQLTAEVFNETGDMFFRCLCNGCEEGCDCEQENCCGDLYSYHTGFLEVLNQHLDLGAFTATAKAVWKPISFTVQYVAGEGEAYKTEPSDYAKLLTANAWALEGERLPAFRRDEYLTGFTLAIADGEGESVASDADLFEKLRTYLEKLDSFSETAAAGVSVTLTAQWAPRTIEITIDYDDNAGDKSVTEKTASEFFEGEGERLPAFHEKNGYGFLEGEQDWQINGEGKYRYEDEAINAIVDAYLKQYSGDVRSAKLTFIFTPIRTEKEITVNFTGADWLEEGARTKVYSYSEIAGGEFRLPAHNGYYVLWESAFSNDDAVLYTFTTSTYKDGAQTFTGSLDDELQRLLLGYLDRGGNATAYETKFSLKEHTAREIALSYETENGTAVAKETLSYADLLGDAPQYAFRMSMRAGYYLSAWTWEEGKHTLSRSAAIEELASLLMQYADEVNASETLNISLKANWTEREIVIRYDPQGGKDIPEERYSYSGLNNWKDEYAAREQSVYTTHAGYYFASWASEAGSLQRGANADSAIAALRTYADGQDLAEVTVTLSATWQEKKIKISYSGLSGVSGGPSGSTINYFSSFTLPGAGSKTGYNFTNYSFNNKTYSANANPISDLRSYADTKDETTISVTFTEQWKINSYKITINSSGNKGGSISGVVDGGMYEYNTNISVTISYYGNKNSYYVRDGNNLGDVSSDTFDMPAHDVALEVHSDYEEPPDPDWCYSDGTMIYMADGTKKPIETLSVGDMVLAVNHYTGQIEARPIALTAHYEEAAKAYEILNLTFSNGTVLKIIHEHALFDLTKNKYVAISVDNVESYLGDTFAYVAQDAFGEYIYESVTLKSYFVTKEWTGRYAVVSMGAWNVIAEGLVSTVSFQGFVEFINIFEYGDGLKYDEQKMQADIDRYGLFTYEEMQGAIPKEVFDAFNVQYFKVAIGKGILDPDLMAELFEKYHQYV